MGKNKVQSSRDLDGKDPSFACLCAFLKGRDFSKQKANATTLCEELCASNCVYRSRGAPTKCNRPPLVQLGKTADQHCFEFNFA